MHKTLADCWDFIQKHQPSAWYFAGADLVIIDKPGVYGWDASRAPDGKLTVKMSPDALRDLASLVGRSSP